MDRKFCIYCGKSLEAEAAFCSACGKRQPAHATAPEPQNPTPVYTPTPRRTKKPCRFSVPDIIRNSILTFLALVILILAFCPVIKCSVFFGKNDLEMKVSTVDQIVLLFDSFKSVEHAEIESKMYKKYLELYDDLLFYADELGDVFHNDSAGRSKLCFLKTRMMVQSGKFTAPAAFYVASAVSIVYILNAIALFVLSVLNLLTTFKIVKDEKKSIFKWTARALTLTPTLLLLTFGSIKIALANGAPASMTFGAFTALTSAIEAIIAFLILRRVFNKSERMPGLAPRIIATALSIIVICLSFAPVATATADVTLRHSVHKESIVMEIGASFFTTQHVDKETKEELKDQVENYSTQKKKELVEEKLAAFQEHFRINEALGSKLHQNLLTTLVGCKLGGKMLELISLAGLAFLGALGGAAIILWQNASYFATGEYSEKSVIIGKIVSAACAVIALGVSIAYVIITKGFIATYLPDDYKVSITAGVICLAIFAIGSIFCPHKAPRVKKNDEIVEAEQI